MKGFFAVFAIPTLLILTGCSTTQSGTSEQTQTQAQSTQEMAATDELIMVDLVVMNEGHTIEERRAYEDAVLPLAERYGMERIASYDLVQHLNGKAEDAVKLNLWSLPGPGAIQQLNQDADYVALEDQRNELHDFNQLTLYMANPVQDIVELDADLYLVDLVVMSEGYGLEERREYESNILPIAEKNGFQRTHSYETVDFLNGSVEDVIKVNLWSLPGPEAIEQLENDPEYQTFIPRRNEIHDFESLTLYLATPAE